VDPALLLLMDTFPTAVAYVINRRLDILASNALADALLSPLSRPREMIRSLFHDPAARLLFDDWPAVARDSVQALRLATGHDPADPDTAVLIKGLLDDSEDFATLWHTHTVSRLGSTTKTFRHPASGLSPSPTRPSTSKPPWTVPPRRHRSSRQPAGRRPRPAEARLTQPAGSRPPAHSLSRAAVPRARAASSKVAAAARAAAAAAGS
jgi:hypothetical protein